MRRLATAVFVAALLAAASARAVEPDEMLSDPALEARARHISQELRCVVCQNQTIDDSNAPLAHDMRLLVRERLVAGDTDKQAVAYIVARYGDFVLLRPPFQPDTWILWLAPFAVLGVATYGLMRQMRRPSTLTVAKPLSADERRRVEQLLNERQSEQGRP